MSVSYGDVQTFNVPHCDKAQAVKILEEAAEVYAAWQNLLANDYSYYERSALQEEAADLVQALSNLLCAVGITDMRPELVRTVKKNTRRGHVYETHDL